MKRETDLHDAITSTITALAIDESRKNNEIVDLTSLWEKYF